MSSNLNTIINEFQSDLFSYQNLIKHSKQSSLSVGLAHLKKNFHPQIDDDELEELGDELAKKIQAQTIQIATEDPFFATDLIVFADSYQGNLPLNGIYESEFEEMHQFLDDIVSGQSLIRIKDDIDFKRAVMMDLILLMTRSIGRSLVRLLMKGSRKIYIRPADPETASSSEISERSRINNGILERVGVIYLRLQPMECFASKSSYNRESYKFPFPRYLVLAHEMIHEFHIQKDRINMMLNRYFPSNIDPAYTNLEEQIAITGCKDPKAINFLDVDVLSENLEEEMEMELDTNNYELITEWAFCASFGLPIRENHYGAGEILPGQLNKTNSRGESALGEAIRLNHRLDIRALLAWGVDINQPCDSKLNTPLHLAIGKEDPELVCWILNLHPRMDIQNSSKEITLVTALYSKNPEILPLLKTAMRNRFYIG